MKEWRDERIYSNDSCNCMDTDNCQVTVDREYSGVDSRDYSCVDSRDNRVVRDSVYSIMGHSFDTIPTENKQVECMQNASERLLVFKRTCSVFNANLTLKKPIVLYPELKDLLTIAVGLHCNPEKFSVVLCNLYACYLNGGVLCVQKNHHKGNNMRAYTPILDRLHSQGYVGKATGYMPYSGNGEATRYWSLPKMEHAFNAVQVSMLYEALPPAIQLHKTLKNGDTVSVQPRNKTFAVKLRGETVDSLNTAYREHYFSFADGLPLFPYLSAVYCHNSFSCGGRLYSYGRLNSRPFQQLSQTERLSICIDGEPCTEIDFCGLHPHLLYTEKSLQCNGDPYAFAPKAERPLAKLLLLIAINADNDHKACTAMMQKINGYVKGVFDDDGEPLKDSVTAILRAWNGVGGNYGWSVYKWACSALKKAKEYHLPIADSFCSGAGVRLQNKDGALMTEILHVCLNQGIIGLPVHDSLICAVKHAETVKQIMQETYKKHTGFTCEVEEK